MKRFLTEDWVVTLLSIPLLILAGCASWLPNGGPKIPETLITANAWMNIGIFFVIALVLLFVGNKLLGRPMRGLLVSFIVIFAIAVLAQWVAKIDTVKYSALRLYSSLSSLDSSYATYSEFQSGLSPLSRESSLLRLVWYVSVQRYSSAT